MFLWNWSRREYFRRKLLELVLFRRNSQLCDIDSCSSTSSSPQCHVILHTGARSCTCPHPDNLIHSLVNSNLASKVPGADDEYYPRRPRISIISGWRRQRRTGTNSREYEIDVIFIHSPDVTFSCIFGTPVAAAARNQLHLCLDFRDKMWNCTGGRMQMNSNAAGSTNTSIIITYGR